MQDLEVQKNTVEDEAAYLQSSDEQGSSSHSVIEKPQQQQPQEQLEQTRPTGFTLYACVISLILSIFLAALDIMIVSTIIENVAREFGDYSKTGWIYAGYSLPSALLTLIWGRIAAVCGFKSSMLTAIIIFEVGSLVAALANSMDMLIGGRVIAGLGGSGIQTLCFVIISTLVEESKRGLLIACMGSAFGIASVVGPFLGGAFTTHVTWRWCFWINLPIGGLAFAFFILFYNPHGSDQTFVGYVTGFFKQVGGWLKNSGKLLKLSTWRMIVHELIYKFDIIEFALCTTGLVLILLALSFGGNKYAWNSGSTIAMFVIGILVTILALVYDFAIFPRLKVVRENPRYQPLIPLRVAKKFFICVNNIAVFFVCMAFMAQVNYIIQFFQLIYNETAWKASIHVIACVVPTVITVITSGILNSKFGIVKPINVLGITAAIVGAGLLTLLTNKSTNSEHIGLLILPGVAFGATMQSTLIGSQIQLDKKSTHYRMDFIAVTTMNNFLKNLGQAFGGVLCNTVFTTSILNKLKQNDITIGDHTTSDALISYRASHFDGSTSLLGNLISDSIKNVFYMCLGCAAIAFIFGIFSSNKKSELHKPTSDTQKETSSDDAQEEEPK